MIRSAGRMPKRRCTTAHGSLRQKPPVRRRVRAGLDGRGRFVRLLGAQQRLPPRTRPVAEARQTLGIVAVNPIAGATAPRTLA